MTTGSQDPFGGGVPAGLLNGATSGAPSFLGVPGGYTPPSQPVPTMPGDNFESGMEMAPGPGNAPQYTAGDALGPLSNPEIIPQLQSQMVNAGLLSIDSVRPGQWGTPEITAYKKVLEFANQHGINAQQALQVLGQNPTVKQIQSGGAGGSSGGSGRTFALDNPLDIQATAQDTAVKLIGRRLDPQNAKAITDWIAMQEKNSANAARSTGSDYTSAASPGALADQYLREHNEPDILGQGAAMRMNEFFQLLHSPVG